MGKKGFLQLGDQRPAALTIKSRIDSFDYIRIRSGAPSGKAVCGVERRSRQWDLFTSGWMMISFSVAEREPHLASQLSLEVSCCGHRTGFQVSVWGSCRKVPESVDRVQKHKEHLIGISMNKNAQDKGT